MLSPAKSPCREIPPPPNASTGNAPGIPRKIVGIQALQGIEMAEGEGLRLLVLLKYETKFNGKILSSKSRPAEDIKDIIFVRV